MIIYRVNAGQDSSDHRTEASAIREAETLLTQYEPWDVSVSMIERNGSYWSTTRVWPKLGRTIDGR